MSNNKVFELISIALMISHEYPYQLAQTYLYNTNSEAFERQEDVLNTLQLSVDSFFPYDYGYIPLPELLDNDTKKEYLQSFHNKKWDKQFWEIKDGWEFRERFRIEFKHTEMYSGWWRFHIQKAMNLARTWCQENGIRYSEPKD